jgi:hypothetical protein
VCPGGTIEIRLGRWLIHSLRFMFTVFLPPKIVNLWWWAKSRSDFGCSWVESQSKIKRSTASALKNDLFGI